MEKSLNIGSTDRSRLKGDQKTITIVLMKGQEPIDSAYICRLTKLLLLIEFVGDVLNVLLGFVDSPSSQSSNPSSHISETLPICSINSSLTAFPADEAIDRQSSGVSNP